MRTLALLALAMLAACARPAADDGERQRPTIVSLNPCSDAVLAEVADPAQILALSHFSHDPASSSMDLAKARSFRAVSGSVEEIAALSPDVVVAGSFLAPSTRSALDDLGIRVVTVPIATDVAESKAQVMQLARLVGNEHAGALLNARIDAALTRAVPQEASARPSALVWQAGGIVPGHDTLVADLLERTGFSNLAVTRGMRQADYLPLEQVVADPPAVIFSAGDKRSAENRQLSHPALSALKGTRVYRFDPSLLWCGGPTIVRAVDRLAMIRGSL